MIVQLEDDIRARLVADANLTGLLGAATSLYNQYVPPDTAMPYVVYDMESAETDDAFRTARYIAGFRVHWYVAERDNANAYSPVVRGRAIELRIMGDWTAQTAGTGPTFGIQRWKPTLTSSGWTADLCEWQRTVADHTGGVMHWIAEFKVGIAKAAA